MYKRILALLLLCLLPLSALADVTYEKESNLFYGFPEMDDWRGRFRNTGKWTIITPSALDDHIALPLGRGETEAAIRERFAAPHFLFEAYSSELPEDVCFRAEVYETDTTREIWHLRHLSRSERTALIAAVENGEYLPELEIYSLGIKGTGNAIWLEGNFTNLPPERHESGRIRIHFINGRMYVFRYCVSGRLFGNSYWYGQKQRDYMERTPITWEESRFRAKLQPRLPDYALDSAFPELVSPGDVTVTGTVERGSRVSANVDGVEISAAVDSKGGFRVTLPLKEEGTHAVTMTVTHKDYTTRVMHYTVKASMAETSLTLLAAPENMEPVGELSVAGVTEPGAEAAFSLDGREAVIVTADEQGCFTHRFEVDDSAGHSAYLTVTAPGKQPTTREMSFFTRFKDAEEGIKSFEPTLSATPFQTMLNNPQEHIGERVKISIYINEVVLTETGLGIFCGYNRPGSSAKNREPMYVEVPGYAQCQLHEKMIVTIYATFQGTRAVVQEGEEQTLPFLQMEFGTYLIVK